MLPKKNRLASRYYINRAKKRGSVFEGKFIIVIYEKVDGAKNFAILVSKKFSKSAVARNRAKRRVSYILRTFLNKVKEGHYVFVPKKNIERSEYEELRVDIDKALSEISKP